MKTIVVPPAAGLFSAFGLLYAEIEHHYSRTVRRVLHDADAASIDAIFGELEAQADAQLAADGFDAAHRACTRSAMLHYQGQIYELEVPVAAARIDRAALDALSESFGREHEQTYGHPGRRGGAGRAGDRAGPGTGPERASPRAGPAEPRRPRGRVRNPPGILRTDARVDSTPRSSHAPRSPAAAKGRASWRSTTPPVSYPPGVRATMDGRGNLLLSL